MSAICGILRFDGGAVARRDVERMLATMAHRAPDRRTVWSAGVAALGHGLMRVTQEELFDSQPLGDREGNITLVADIRLDNRQALGATLGITEAALHDMPDSLLLLRAYKHWGDGCAEHLLGDFVFALWDGRRRVLVLGRDHMGQRSVFYHRGKDFFAFSSELKGLWALGDIPHTHSGHATRLFAPGSENAGTDRPTNGLPGGTVMTIAADGAISSRRYWEPKADPAHADRDEAYYAAAYRRVLGEAVACRLRRTTRPAGLFFSGGFDSSAIAALAGPVVTAQGRKLIAAASVMPQDYDGTIHHARRWTEICRSHMPHLDLRYVTREGRDIFTDMEKAFRTMDGVQGSDRYVHDALYEAVAAGGASLVMDGHGGDYTLNIRGFPWLVNLLRRGKLRDFVKEFRAFRRHAGASIWQTLRSELLVPLLPRRLRDIRARLRHGLALSGATMPFTSEYLASMEDRNAPRPMTRNAAQMRSRMRENLAAQQNIRSVGVAAAVHGLEFTRPFHDKRVVELALAIPEEFWVRGGRERYLARTALHDLYPPQYQTRRRGNDDAGPDFLEMVKRVQPRILAEIDRMEGEGKLGRYFDFPRMRRMLTSRASKDHNSGSEYDTRQAVLVFLRARYMEWFRREN